MKQYNVIHKRSSVKDRVPSANNLKYGEIAVNYCASSETLTIKNSSNQIIKFLPESTVNKMIEDKVEEMSLIMSRALNDLNDRVLDLERKVDLLS